MQLPHWLKEEESYTPAKDRDYFISRSFLRITSLLARYDSSKSADVPAKWLPSPIAALLLLIILILLCAASHQPYFLYTAAAPLLVLLAFQEGNAIKRLLLPAVTAALFSLLILLPAIFFTGNPFTLLLPCKTFLSVLAAGIFTHFYSWHKITAAISWLHVPQTIIFIMDTALRYIYLLGRISCDSLTALQLRSVGYNPHKSAAMAGVLGSLFLKSQEMSQEMYHAMQCRGFTGIYPHSHKNPLRPVDFTLLGVITALVLIYLRLEMLL